MQIKRLILQTSALEKLTDFYIKLMQLPVKKSGVARQSPGVGGHDQKEIAITIGSTELVFQQAKAADPFYHFAINIPANKIEEAKEWLKDRVKLIWMNDYKSDVADFVTWHAKSVYFYDPAGNILELIARFDLDNQTSEPFSSKQFLSVSEIGLVFPEKQFDKRIEKLIKQYGLSYFPKQPPLPQFRAVGDDEGLFIIVPENRHWFPTSKASGVFDIQIEGEANGKFCLRL